MEIALDESVYSVLMNGRTADLVFTDPPYNVRIDGNVCGKGAIRHREFAMACGEMTEAEFVSFLSRALDPLERSQQARLGSLHLYGLASCRGNS